MKEELRSTLTAQVLARHYGFELPKKDNGNMRCPFKNREDKHPSFTVKFDPFMWHDKATNEGGDCFDFIAGMERLDTSLEFKEVMSKAKEIVGIRENQKLIKRTPSIEFAGKEEVSTETAVKYYKKKGINIKKTGIDIRERYGEGFYVPMYDINHTLCGLQTDAKIMFTGSKMGFFMGEELDFNKPVYFVEGLSDFLTMRFKGFENTVGICSVSLNFNKIISFMELFTDKVIVCFDADIKPKKDQGEPSFAGLNLMKRISKTIKSDKIGFNVLKKGKDINDYYQSYGKIEFDTFTEERFEKCVSDMEESNKDAVDEVVNSKKITPEYIAKKVAEEGNVIRSDKVYWIYENSVWKIRPPEAVKEFILMYLVKIGKKHTPKMIKDVMFYLDIFCIKNAGMIEDSLKMVGKFKSIGLNYVYTNKCKINVHTLTTEKITKDDGAISVIDVDIEEGKKIEHCPCFLEFLNSIFEPDDDKEDRIEFIREWLGYCLYKNVPIQEFLYIIGKGGNGKGVLLSIFEAVIGRRNCINVQLNDFKQDSHASTVLVGAYANLISDAEKKTTLDNMMLKEVTGDDLITVNPKGSARITMKPFTKFIIASNYEPIISESADWLKRRINIIRFNRSFKGEEVDVYLKQRLLEEKDGIFWWAMGGLKNLLVRGKFEKPESVKYDTTKFLDNCDIIKSFYKYDIKSKGYKGLRTSMLYERFRIFCEDEGVMQRFIPAKKNFLNRLQYLFEDSEIRNDIFYFNG